MTMEEPTEHSNSDDRQRRTDAMSFAVQLYHEAFAAQGDAANGADELVVETARAIYDFLRGDSAFRFGTYDDRSDA